MLIVKWGRIGIEPIHEDWTYRWLCLGDVLHWGPQHVDLDVEVRMRMEYHRSTWPRDELANLEACRAALLAGEDVRLWCEPTLGCSLAHLRLLHWLYVSKTDAPPGGGQGSVAAWQRLERGSVLLALEEALLARDYLPDLAELRAHMAGERGLLDPDVSKLPGAIRGHFDAVRLLVDFMPDERGLDVMDRVLIGHLGNEWTRAVKLIVESVKQLPPHYDIGDLWLWDRALELCGMFPGSWRSQWQEELVDPDFAKGCTLQTARFRLSQLGLAVKEGRAEALAQRRFYRWVGGRLLANDPSLDDPDDP